MTDFGVHRCALPMNMIIRHLCHLPLMKTIPLLIDLITIFTNELWCKSLLFCIYRITVTLANLLLHPATFISH